MKLTALVFFAVSFFVLFAFKQPQVLSQGEDVALITSSSTEKQYFGYYHPRIKRFQCNKRTGERLDPLNKEDEIIIQFIYRNSDGYNFQWTTGEFNIKEGEQKIDINTYCDFFYNFVRKNSSLLINIYEHDGGNSDEYVTIAKAILNDCSDPLCIAGTKVLDKIQDLGLRYVDQDDYIGSFSIVWGYPDGKDFSKGSYAYAKNFARGSEWSGHPMGYYFALNGAEADFEVMVEFETSCP